MSFFKKLVKGIAIGAAVFFTGGLALSAVGITSIAGTAITLKGAAIYGAVYGGLQGAAMGLVKKPKMQTQSISDRQNISVDPQAFGKWVFGETAMGTDIVYNEVIGEEKIIHVVAGACHEIESYGNFYINDELINFSSDISTGDWAGVLTVKRNLGTADQTALSFPGGQWPVTARGRGFAHYGLVWDFTSAKGKEKLASGIPTRLTQVVRGSKVYDPRLDSTNGGTGAHRATDQSTWGWSDNWALIVAHYLLGYYTNGKLIYGVGCDVSEIDWPQVIAMADVCDTVIDEKPRYRISGIIDTTQNHETIIGELEACIGGMVSKSGGRYYIWCPHNDLTPVGTLTDDDIVSSSGVNFTPAGPIENLYNTGDGRFVNPDLLYQLSPYPQVVEAAAVTEDGKPRRLEMDLTFIQDVSIAQRVCREMIRRSRFTGTINVAVGPRGLLLKPFDVINVNFRETDYTNELFRVVSLQYSAQGVVVLELIEEDSSIYDTSAPLGTSLVQLNPDSFDPATAFVVENLQAENGAINNVGGGAVDAIIVTWDAPSAFVEFSEIGYRVNFIDDWIFTRASQSDRAVISPALPDANYEIRVRHWSIEGVAGPWSVVVNTTGNADFTRISFLGIDDPIDPKLFITLNSETKISNAKISLKFAQNEFNAIPDKFFLFYSVADAPNRLKITNDAGTKLYISTAVGDGVSGLFNLEVAAGSTNKALNFVNSSSVDIDTSGNWWVSARNDPGAASPYAKVVAIENSTILFAPDITLPFVPSAGQLIDVAEVDFVDGRVGEFRLAFLNGEVIRHSGIQFDGNYYIQVVERGAEGTTQANQTGQFADYYPAPGPQTDIIQISAGDFIENNGEFFFSGQLTVNIPVDLQWAAATCCLARSVIFEGKELFIRSRIIPLTHAGPA